LGLLFPPSPQSCCYRHSRPPFPPKVDVRSSVSFSSPGGLWVFLGFRCSALWSCLKAISVLQRYHFLSCAGGRLPWAELICLLPREIRRLIVSKWRRSLVVQITCLSLSPARSLSSSPPQPTGFAPFFVLSCTLWYPRRFPSSLSVLLLHVVGLTLSFVKRRCPIFRPRSSCVIFAMTPLIPRRPS